MQKSKKLIVYFSIAFVVILMLSLFYYSMRATLVDYFFENNQEVREKLTSASGDQAQIMVDLANKQLAKQQVDTEVRKDEAKTKSLFKELSGSKATVKSTTTELEKKEDTVVETSGSSSEKVTESEARTPNQVKNGFVVVDCEKGAVIACPHHEVQTGTSPLYYKNAQSHFLVGRCLDVSIDVKTFCPL